MLSAWERASVMAGALAEQAEPYVQSTIGSRFLSQVRQHPDRTALVFGDTSLTYAQLNERASRLAACLRNSGVGPETPVALLLEPSIELIVAMVGVLMAGGAYLPLDTKSPAARLLTVLKDSSAPVVLSVQRLSHVVPGGAPRVILLDCELPGSAEVDEPSTAEAGNLAYIIYTSGSTGTPKGVTIEHRSVLNLTRWLGREAFGRFDGPVRTALIAPAAFDASVQQIFGCLLNGHTLYPVDMETRRDGTRMRRFLRQHGIQLADCTPSLLSILCDAGIPSDRDLALGCLLVGGEALPVTLVDEFYRQDVEKRIVILNVYGPTECCVDSTFLDVTTERRRRTVESIGRGVPNSEIFILDTHGNLLPEGVAGEIYIAGVGVGRGYWKRPSLTAAAFVPHPFRVGERIYRTGDRGYWSAGQIEFLGRDDDQVKVRGHRIQLGDIESHLAMHPGIRQVFVQTRETAMSHKELVAYLAGDPSLTVSDLRKFAASVLPEYMIPASFVMLDALPLNGNGKVDRKRLPAPEETPSVKQGSEFIAPRTEKELAVASVWSTVLGRGQIGIRDHYIALGGDSIKALQISARLRDLGWKLELSDLFQHPCIADLAPHLRRLKGDSTVDDNAIGSVPLAPIQLRFFQEFDGALHHFNQSVLLQSPGTMCVETLQKALNAVYDHHDMLRATYARKDGEWVQRVADTGEPAPLDVVDVEEATAHANAAQGTLNLENGPLFRAILYRTPRGERLFLFAHHLVIDAVSWRIVLEDLESAYRQASNGSRVQLPAKTASFRRWVEHLQSLATTKETLSEDWPSATRGSDAGIRAAECASVSREVPVGLTADVLFGCHKAYGTDANDVLLAALARAMRLRTGNAATAVLLEGHGRGATKDEPDVSRTVGWFTTVYPVVLDLGASVDIERNVKVVKEALRRVPRKGLGYGLRRYLAPPEHRISGPEPSIVFNYLGQFGASGDSPLFSRAVEDTGPMSDPNARFLHDIEINALATDGRLRFHFSYNPEKYTEGEMNLLTDCYLEELKTLAGHMCSRLERELTPSDVDYKGFNLDEMDSFLNNLPG
jgi:bacitracin synthase 1